MGAVNKLQTELKKEKFRVEDIAKLSLLKDLLKKLAEITAMVSDLLFFFF